VLDAFAGVVEPVFGKFDRKAMKRAFVKTRDESFHHLFCYQLKGGKLLQPVDVYCVFHA
jgi:hypothetical protein